ncbi:tRNA (guanine(46)-N(7))-methyltransferase TrmB [Elioraea thermophila]|uniref:tRNA (guanine(46)-N(7))-methyltransferase TrmB n=1 Tax=Elioraea thermophila TaxID=2185104 RepID=UPI000DF194AD|nr:tRNA (guanine(46)-N(7))-methyltransferase TrmB [Elioraea thermophila]
MPATEASPRSRKLDRPPVERLYGRRRGHALRPRQARLLAHTLPRVRLSETAAQSPFAAFPCPVRELWLEVGFGSGEHTAELVARHPEVGIIAAEVFENGIVSFLARYVPEGEEETAALPPNLVLWPDDARALLRLLPEASISRLFLLFPDPWPKARHARRRFVHPALIPLIARVMAPRGEWRIASDDPTYQAWVEETLAGQDRFDIVSVSAIRPEGWPGTRYEAKALREGRTPRYWTLRRR